MHPADISLSVAETNRLRLSLGLRPLRISPTVNTTNSPAPLHNRSPSTNAAAAPPVTPTPTHLAATLSAARRARRQRAAVATTTSTPTAPPHPDTDADADTAELSAWVAAQRAAPTPAVPVRQPRRTRRPTVPSATLSSSSSSSSSPPPPRRAAHSANPSLSPSNPLSAPSAASAPTALRPVTHTLHAPPRTIPSDFVTAPHIARRARKHRSSKHRRRHDRKQDINPTHIHVDKQTDTINHVKNQHRHGDDHGLSHVPQISSRARARDREMRETSMHGAEVKRQPLEVRPQRDDDEDDEDDDAHYAKLLRARAAARRRAAERLAENVSAAAMATAAATDDANPSSGRARPAEDPSVQEDAEQNKRADGDKDKQQEDEEEDEEMVVEHGARAMFDELASFLRRVEPPAPPRSSADADADADADMMAVGKSENVLDSVRVAKANGVEGGHETQTGLSTGDALRTGDARRSDVDGYGNDDDGQAVLKDDEDKEDKEDNGDGLTGMAGTLQRLRESGALSRRRSRVGRARDRTTLASTTRDMSSSSDEGVEGIQGENGQRKKRRVANGTVQLSYQDEFGNEVTPKEAFRMLCHRFHGNRPGKNKQEKRLRMMLDRVRARCATEGETPLRAAAVLKEETRRLGAAHVVLSGESGVGRRSDDVSNEGDEEGKKGVKRQRV